MSSEKVFPLVVGAVGLAILFHFSFKMIRIGRAARTLGRPQPKSLVAFWIALVVAVLGYAVWLVSTLLGG